VYGAVYNRDERCRDRKSSDCEEGGFFRHDIQFDDRRDGFHWNALDANLTEVDIVSDTAISRTAICTVAFFIQYISLTQSFDKIDI